MKNGWLLFLVVCLTFNFQLSTRNCFSAEKELVGYWSFDEGKGDMAKDSSGNKSDGEIVGGVEWVDGKFGKALKFDGEDAYIEIPSETIGTAEQMTIECWVKPLDQIEGNYKFHKDIIRSQCYGGGLWGISTQGDFNASGGLAIQVGWITGADAWWGPAEAKIAKGDWNHLVVVLDRATGKSTFYCNGKKLVEATQTIGELPITAGFRMASDCAGAFKGIIDEVKIYNRALSADEVKTSYSRK